MSRLNVENIRHPDAASDSLQLSDTGNVTAPGNLSVTGTSTLTDDLNVDSGTLFVDVSTDRVGIGTSTPSSHLHISANTPALAFQPTADTQENQILFRNAANDATPGRIAYDHNTDQMLFSTNSSQRVRILSDGALQLVNSTGIDFSQIQTNATGMTSETLDSYEEGTWTPAITDSTATTAIGRYTKIGRKVFISWRYTTSDRTSGAVNMQLTGYPFSPTDINSFGGGVTIRNGVDGGDQLTVSYDGGFAAIKFMKNTNSANGATLQLDEVGANYSLFGWAMYDV